MEAMSSETAGRPSFQKRSVISAVFRQICRGASGSYLLGYYSTDERADGGFRQIKVQVRRDGTCACAPSGLLCTGFKINLTSAPLTSDF